MSETPVFKSETSVSKLETLVSKLETSVSKSKTPVFRSETSVSKSEILVTGFVLRKTEHPYGRSFDSCGVFVSHFDPFLAQNKFWKARYPR
jgi:hypothetical protein